jgi:hypothetical protein
MIVVPEPKFRVGRSGGCDQWIGSPLRPYPAQVVDLAGRRRNAANRTAVAPPVAVFDRGLGGLPISSTPSSDADHALTKGPARSSTRDTFHPMATFPRNPDVWPPAPPALLLGS